MNAIDIDMMAWHNLTSRAYEKWDKGSLKGLRYTEFLRALPDAEKAAVLLDSLVGQVLNGGFLQWIVNGYCCAIADVIAVVKQVEQPASRQVLLMLVQIEPYIQKDREKGENFEQLVIPVVQNLAHPFWDKLDRFSYLFAVFDKQIKQEVATFLTGQI